MTNGASSLVNREQGGVVNWESHVTNAASSLVNREQGGVVNRESHMTNGGVVNRESHTTNAVCSLANQQQGGVAIIYQPMTATPVPSSHPLCQGVLTHDMPALPCHTPLLNFTPSESVPKYRLIEGVPNYQPFERAPDCRLSPRKVPMSRRPASKSSTPQGKDSVPKSSRTFKMEKGLGMTSGENSASAASTGTPAGDKDSTQEASIPPTERRPTECGQHIKGTICSQSSSSSGTSSTTDNASPVSNAFICDSPPQPRAKLNQQNHQKAAPSIGPLRKCTSVDDLADLDMITFLNCAIHLMNHSQWETTEAR